jgi:hypothetical protein
MTALPCTSGGSATELSATGAWRKAAAGDEMDMVVRRTNSESFGLAVAGLGILIAYFNR